MRTDSRNCSLNIICTWVSSAAHYTLILIHVFNFPELKSKSTGHTDLLRPSILPERLTSRWLTCEPVSEVGGTGVVSIASGLGLLRSEVRGKTIGMENGLACGNPVERLG